MEKGRYGEKYHKADFLHPGEKWSTPETININEVINNLSAFKELYKTRVLSKLKELNELKNNTKENRKILADQDRRNALTTLQLTAMLQNQTEWPQRAQELETKLNLALNQTTYSGKILNKTIAKKIEGGNKLNELLSAISKPGVIAQKYQNNPSQLILDCYETEGILREALNPKTTRTDEKKQRPVLKKVASIKSSPYKRRYGTGPTNLPPDVD